MIKKHGAPKFLSKTKNTFKATIWDGKKGRINHRPLQSNPSYQYFEEKTSKTMFK